MNRNLQYLQNKLVLFIKLTTTEGKEQSWHKEHRASKEGLRSKESGKYVCKSQ